MTPEAIASIEGAVQPLIFATDSEEARCSSVLGTLFLVMFDGRAFAITTRHAFHIEPEAAVAPALWIYPNDNSRRMLPLKDLAIPKPVYDDPLMDFAVIEVDIKSLDEETADATLIDLEKAAPDWLGESDSAQFVILGYPGELSRVDYEREVISSLRVVLSGRYIGQSSINGLHELEIVPQSKLASFGGLSGSPVFSWMEQDGIGKITFCGMVLLGTPSSGMVHFLDRDVIIAALTTKCRVDA